MPKSIAILSGKGGSGKTSLALTLASLLSECEIKTLVIDCDLATNGATYFFEDRLKPNDNCVSSFSELLSNKHGNITTIVENDYFSFFPSISKITEISYDNSKSNDINEKIKELTRGYEVVIYDTQAGFSEALEAIIPQLDTIIFVTEPDAVSAASLRSLYLKIGKRIEKVKIYQVMNKATDDERNSYLKISGTVFNVISAIRFDWMIRKAFSLSSIPSIYQCGPTFVQDVFDIGKITCDAKDTKEKINSYILRYKRKELIEKKKSIESGYSIVERRKSRIRRQKRFIQYAGLMGFMLSMIFFIINNTTEIFNDEKNSYTITLAVMMLFFVAIFLAGPYTIDYLYQTTLKDKNFDLTPDEDFELYEVNSELEIVEEQISRSREKAEKENGEIPEYMRKNKKSRKE